MKRIMVFVLSLLVLAGFAASHSGKIGYESISMGEGKKLYKSRPDRILADVRNREEYEDGHIPGAASIPLASIGTKDPSLLKSKEQLILACCRSGERSKQDAEKLAALGYSNVKETGGINSWEGPLVTGNQPGNRL